METRTSLDITEFFSICSQVILHSGGIIRDIFNSEGLVAKTKNGDEPFTEADVKVQTLLIKGLRTIWPDIKIIGEEDEVFDKDLGFDFNTLSTTVIPKDLFKDFKNSTIDLSKAIVWVDPLDGTVEFIKGALDCVTTLIGISVDGVAKVGVIGKYFVEEDNQKYRWEPKCYFAHADHPHLYYIDYSNENKLEEQKPVLVAGTLPELRICTTRNHWTPELQGKLDKLQADSVEKMGGAGNKVLAVIQGVADCSFYPKPGMKRWDICAGDAILKSVGGIVTDANGDPLKYEAERSKWPCDKGVIASASIEKHNRVMSYYLK